MKSQKLGAQGERDERLCIDFGFKAQDLMEAAACLDEAERHEVEQLGYGAFLNLKLGPISQRKETYLCMELVDLEEDAIKVQLQNDVIINFPFQLKSLEQICYAQSSRFCIQSAVDSQDVRSAMVTSAVVTSGVPDSQEAIHSTVQILSSVQNPESFGVYQENLDACIAGLSALQPVGASCSNVGASCSISEAAEATSTKKADEEETIALQPVGSSCSNVGDSCSISDNTKKAGAAVPEAANTAVHEEGISKAAKSRSHATKTPVLPRRSPRLNAAC